VLRFFPGLRISQGFRWANCAGFVTPALATEIAFLRLFMQISSAYRITAAVALLISANASYGQTLFQSDLDSGTGWSIFQEATNPSSLATFGYDYTAVGIPPSPNGGGSTLGLRFAANGLGSIQAITAATNLTFSGQFRVTFDFWGNTNGGLPVGGTGSTEYLGGGVGFSGTLPRKGASALASIEGNGNPDWRLDKDAAAQSLASGFYNPSITSLNVTSATSADPSFFFNGPFPGQPAPGVQGVTGTPYNGTIAFGWHTMTIEADSIAGTARFTIDSTYLGTLTQATGALSIAGAGSLTLLDPFGGSISNSDLVADQVFAVFDNYRVEVIPEPAVGSLVALSALPLLRRRRTSPQ
jgi:hypothetical protein